MDWIAAIKKRQSFYEFIQEQRTRVIRVLVVAIVLGIAGAIAFYLPKISKLYSIMILGMLIILPACLLLWRYPHIGIVGLVGASLLVSFAIDTGSDSEINITILMLVLLSILWLFDMVLLQRRVWLLKSRPIIPLLVFIVVSMLAFISGQIIWFQSIVVQAPITSQIAGLAIILLSVAAFLLVAHQVPDERWLVITTWLFIIIGALYLSGLLIPNWGKVVFSFLPRGSAGSLFWVWLGVLGFAQAFINNKLKIILRILLILLVLAAFYAHFFGGQSWVSGWLPMTVGISTVLVIGMWRRFGRLFIPIIIILFIVLTPMLIPQVQSIVSQDEYSFVTRIEAWRIITEIVKVNPILGLGPANYRFYTPYFPIFGYAVAFNSHNNYVDLFAQIGLLGLASFFWFFFETLRLCFRLYVCVPEGFPKAYVIAAFGGIAGTLTAGMLGDWIIPFIYNIGLQGFRTSVLAWIFLGGLLVIEKNLNLPQ